MTVYYRVLLLSQFCAIFLLFLSAIAWSADAAQYRSEPEDRSGVLMTQNALGAPGTAGIRFSEIGTEDLLISADSVLLQGSHANEFQVLTPLPIRIADGGAPRTLVVRCNAAGDGLRTAVLRLITNDPQTPKLLYPLGCVNKYVATAEFASFPSPNSEIKFAQAAPGQTRRASLTLLNQGVLTTASGQLEISNINLSGTHQAEFSLQLLDSTANTSTLNTTSLRPVQNFALLGTQSRQLVISCTPSEVGERVARLNLQTSDPKHSSVSYPLSCPSDQAFPPSDILLSNAQVRAGESAGTLIGTLSTLDENPDDTHTYALSADSSPLFNLVDANLVLAQTAVPSAAPYLIRVLSTDSAGHTLEKEFAIQVLANAQFDAVAFSETQGLVVDTLDSPEPFRLTGILQPQPEHVGLNAQIAVIYTYTAPNGSVIRLAPIDLGERLLFSNTQIALYQGKLLFLPGLIEVELSYTLDDGSTYQGLAKVLNVRPNRAPQRIIFDTQIIPENSPPGTLVSRLETLDADQGDHFIYAIIDNPGEPLGYFEIIGNELRLANSFPLNFEDTPEVNLTLRSIDASGAFVDQSIRLDITNEIEAQFFGELRSAGTLLPNSVDKVPTVRGDYPLTLTARILPEPSHIGKNAEIYYHINYVDVFAEEDTPPLEGVLDSNATLTELLDYPLFEQMLTELSGTAQVSVGYRLLDGSDFAASGIIAAFTLEAKTALQKDWETLPQPTCHSEYQLPAMLDLSQVPDNFNGTALLAQFNAIPAVSQAGLNVQQDAPNNTLFVELNGQRLAWWPLLVRRDNHAPNANATLNARQTLKLVTDEQLEIIAQPAVHDLCALQTALSQQGFNALQIHNNGNIHAASDDGNGLISMRADVFLSNAETSTTGFFMRESSALLILTDETGELKQQAFYASVAWPEQLAAHVSGLKFNDWQRLSFNWASDRYVGIPALEIQREANSQTDFYIETIGDLNADGADDFAVQYNNGERQVFYGVND